MHETVSQLYLWLADGAAALPAIACLFMATAVCLTLYKLLKSRTARPRPFATEPGFHVTVDPLDEFSFPSGHTLHAVAFTLVLAVHYPLVLWCVIPFTCSSPCRVSCSGCTIRATC